MSIPLTRRLLTRSIPLAVGSTSQLASLRFTPVVGSRSFITSPFRSLATPTTSPSPSHITPGPPKTPNPADASNRDASHLGSREPEKAVTADYSKGPSALDKASQLFFFTEILRGSSPPLLVGTLGLELMYPNRHVDRSRAVLPSVFAFATQPAVTNTPFLQARHTPSCTHSRRAQLLLGSVASTPSEGTLTARSAASVSHSSRSE